MSIVFKKSLLASALTASLLLQATPASALGLLEAYELALKNDPTYMSAVYDRQAGQEHEVLGRAGMLPNIAMSYSKYENHAEITALNAFTQRENTTDRRYDSSSGTLQLLQPILNLEGLAIYHQGVAQTNYSEAVFSGQSQELAVRVLNAYADAQYAEDQLALVTAQRDAYAEQMRVNDRMFKKGEGTRTDMLETQAKYDLAEAQVIEAADSLTTARNTLAAIVGVDVTHLDPMSEDFQVKPMQPASFDEWKSMALAQNAEVVAFRHAVEVARLDITKAKSGHAPRLDFLATYSNNSSETINTLDQKSKSHAVGLQLNIPIYSGGSVSASTRRAVANHEKTKADLDAKTKEVLVELRKQYSLALSSTNKIDALVKSVDSATALVEATRQSIKGGVRINLDLLTAQQQLYAARRDLAQARYQYLISYLRLRSTAGQLRVEDLRTVAGYFVARR